jgi:glycine betaine/proline transport system substrate-binding protein
MRASRRKFLTALSATIAAPVILSMSRGKAAELPGKGIKVTPMGNTPVTNIMQHYLVGIGLERLGYEMEPYKSATPPILIQAIAQGDATYTAQFWDPLYRVLYTNSGGEANLALLGKFIGGCDQGYLIDKKTADRYNIRNIKQLKDPKIAKLFDTQGDGKAQLAGSEPGWAVERVIEHHLDVYGLRATVKHNEGSYAALIADVIARFKQGKPILYYTYTPLWVSDVLRPGIEVEWLEVPFFSSPDGDTSIRHTLADGRDVGFAVNDERFLVNRKFIEKNPAVAKFFEVANIPIGVINQESLRIYQGGGTKPEDFRREAEKWVEKNSAEMDRWVNESLSAAK